MGPTEKHLLVEAIVVGLDKASLRFLSPTVCMAIAFTFTTVQSGSWRPYRQRERRPVLADWSLEVCAPLRSLYLLGTLRRLLKNNNT